MQVKIYVHSDYVDVYYGNDSIIIDNDEQTFNKLSQLLIKCGDDWPAIYFDQVKDMEFAKKVIESVNYANWQLN